MSEKISSKKSWMKLRFLKSPTVSNQEEPSFLFNKKLLPNTGTVTAWYYIVNWWQLRPGHNSKITSVTTNFLFARLGTSTPSKTPWRPPLNAPFHNLYKLVNRTLDGLLELYQCDCIYVRYLHNIHLHIL